MEPEVLRLQRYYDVDSNNHHMVGQNVKATAHYDSPVMLCDYVYYGRLLAVNEHTYTVLTGYTKVTLMKDNTVLERWDDAGN